MNIEEKIRVGFEPTLFILNNENYSKIFKEFCQRVPKEGICTFHANNISIKGQTFKIAELFSQLKFLFDKYLAKW